MPTKSYFLIIVSVLFLNIYTQMARAGATCSGCSPCACGGSSGSSCSTNTTVTSTAMTITKVPFTYAQTLDLGCYGEKTDSIDIKKIPASITYFGMTLDIMKLPFDIPASNPFNKGGCVSCGGCNACPTSQLFDIYQLLKIKPSSCKSS